jgi:hypothetical protein
VRLEGRWQIIVSNGTLWCCDVELSTSATRRLMMMMMMMMMIKPSYHQGFLTTSITCITTEANMCMVF